MATGTYSPNPFYQFDDDNGDPLSGGLLYTYAAGTSTPLATYSNVGLTVANANPIVLDSAGRCTIFLSATSYKYILKTSAGVTVATRDNIGAIPNTNIDNDVTGTAGEALTAVQVAYLLATTWFKADADAVASSTLPTIGFVVTDIASAASGTFRLSGRMEGFSGLTPGADYYVSGTAGEITSTAPANARYVGRADSISSLIITPNPPPITPGTITALIDLRIKTVCNGRLSLTTAVPVTSADVTAATAIKWVPYQGNEVALYSGSAWVAFALAELSIAVPATTNQMYDAFVDYNAGTPALSLTAWTNDTTRATALTTQDGVLVLTGSTGKRYVGSCRTTGVSGQTEDSFAKRFLWNYYHRQPREMLVSEATNSWAYSTTTWRQANAAAGNQLAFVVGVAEVPFHAEVRGAASNSAATVGVAVAVGLDSTSAPTTGNVGMGNFTQSGVITSVISTLRVYPAVGYHFAAWLEIDITGGGGGTTTWYGDNNAPTHYQSGISGRILG